MIAQVSTSTVASRWGFHPCDAATYRKLKALRKCVTAARSRLATWVRWDRKAPHNRVTRKRLRNAARQTVGYGDPVPQPEPNVTTAWFSLRKFDSYTDPRTGEWLGSKQSFERPCLSELALKVEADCTNARRPVPAEADVVPLALTVEEIDRLYDEFCG